MLARLDARPDAPRRAPRHRLTRSTAVSIDDPLQIRRLLVMAPHPDDVWSHRQLLRVVSHTPVETQALDELLVGNHGWTDVVRQHHPYGTKLYSWWSYRAPDWQKADKGRRLDHIWVTPHLAERLHSAEVVREARGW